MSTAWFNSMAARRTSRAQLGKGTKFTLCLPAVDAPLAGEACQDPVAVGGAEIMVLEEGRT